MDINKEFRSLAEQFSALLGKGKISILTEKNMDTYDKGYSGAELMRVECTYKTGDVTSFICKKTDLKERMVMRRLTAQGHTCTPAAYS